jgi:hypothetical protein
MLDAHVQFELEQWTGQALDDTVREQVDALVAWLRTVRLADIAPADDIAGVVADLLSDLPLTDDLVALVGEAIAAGHEALCARDGTVGDLVRRQDYDTLVALLITMEDARRELMTAVTESTAYTRLVAHVLYHGLKGYVLTENVLARKIPGASSLVRLGQRGLNSAAPRLEANVDRQLTAFVQANVSDTLRESRRYLDATLDEQMLTAMADDTWETNSGRSVASVVAMLDLDDVDALVALGGDAIRHLRDSGLLADVAETVTRDLLQRHGDRPVGDLLDAVGITEEALARDAASLLRPVVEHAHATGFLESRIRARLAPFYAAYPDRA